MAAQEVHAIVGEPTLLAGVGVVGHHEVAPREGAPHIHLGSRFGVDKNECYRTCDAFVLPSLSEGLPMTVLDQSLAEWEASELGGRNE